MWRKEWLVLRNPSKTITHTVVYSFSLRHSVIFVFVVVVEFVLFLFFCWYHRREKRRRLLLSSLLLAAEKRTDFWFSPSTRTSKYRANKRKTNITLTVPNFHSSQTINNIVAFSDNGSAQENDDLLPSTSPSQTISLNSTDHSNSDPNISNLRLVSSTVHLRSHFHSKKSDSERENDDIEEEDCNETSFNL
jgi:hypothetical protein